MLLREARQFQSVRLVGGIFILSGLVALGVAFGAQHVFHLMPCELCLWERRPWRMLIALGVLSLFISPRYARWPVLGGLACILVSIGLSVLHVGVEHGLWPSPAAECHVAIAHESTVEEWLNHLPARPTKPCDHADYLPGLPVSMTTLAGLYSVMVLGLALVGARRVFRHVRRDRQRAVKENEA